jgi:hypothetical protein
MAKINKNCSIGDVVRVVFDDHGEGEGEIVFEYFGRVLKKTRRDFVIGCWLYADEPMELDDNSVTYIILRSAIKEIQILQEAKPCPRNTKSGNSRQKPANSVAIPQVAERQESAVIIHPEQQDSQSSDSTTGVQNTSQTIF